MLQREKDETRKRIRWRWGINAIKMPIMVMGRTNDNNMPVFRLITSSREAREQVEWKTYHTRSTAHLTFVRNEEGGGLSRAERDVKDTIASTLPEGLNARLLPPESSAAHIQGGPGSAAIDDA